MKRVIATPNAPAAIGAYSQAVRLQSLIFTSGQLPIDPETGAFPAGGIAAQTRQCLMNVRAILESQGASMRNIIKTTVYLNSINDFVEMNRVYASFFDSDFPSRSAFAVAALPKGALVEIEAVAYAD